MHGVAHMTSKKRRLVKGQRFPKFGNLWHESLRDLLGSYNIQRLGWSKCEQAWSEIYMKNKASIIGVILPQVK